MFVIGLSKEEPAFKRTTTWKALVAAKAWVSHYPIALVIIHTICLRVIRNAYMACPVYFIQFKCLCHNGV
ncbi:hypothetical protein DA100_12280 [Vibrio sp. Hep-1b-8]|nr:hypothetical protein DA100_12280 [Vibrio sp. Hep-1b-8]